VTGTPIVNRGVRKLPNHLDLAAAALLRSRRIRISGSGAGSFALANLAAQIPGYLQLIVDGSIAPPTRVFPLSQVSAAWGAASASGTRVVVAPG
jgi:hypothetical protein